MVLTIRQKGDKEGLAWNSHRGDCLNWLAGHGLSG